MSAGTKIRAGSAFTEQAYAAVKARIVAGTYTPGYRLVLAKIADNIVVKLPCTRAGLRGCKTLRHVCRSGTHAISAPRVGGSAAGTNACPGRSPSSSQRIGSMTPMTWRGGSPATRIS